MRTAFRKIEKQLEPIGPRMNYLVPTQVPNPFTKPARKPKVEYIQRQLRILTRWAKADESFYSVIDEWQQRLLAVERGQL